MTSDDKCPRCGAGVMLINADDIPEMLPEVDEFHDEEADVWACADSCGWNEDATDEESLEESLRQIEWLSERLAVIEASKS
jgi:hypothetical protein